MPEQSFEGIEQDRSSVDREKEEQFQKRMEEIRRNLEKHYDDALQEGASPIEKILQDTGASEGARYIHGDERIDLLVSAIRIVSFSDKDEFVQKISDLVKPLVHDRFFKPDSARRTAELDEIHKVEEVRVGKLSASLHASGEEFTFPNSVLIGKNDRVLEIQWPDEGEVPRGLQDIRDAFTAIANKVKEDERIKAVVGTSWMMSHAVTKKLGFEIIKGIDIEADKTSSILDRALKARKDKPYGKHVSEADVKFGAMTREDFLKRYG